MLFNSVMKKSTLVIILFLLLFPLGLSLQSCMENYIVEPFSSDGAPQDKNEVEIDSVSSWYKYDYIYKEGVVELSQELLDALYVDNKYGTILPGVNSISFRSDIDHALLPKVGDILVSKCEHSKTQFGLTGRVTVVNHLSSKVEVALEPVELTDIYEYLYLDVCLNKKQLENTPILLDTRSKGDVYQVSEDEFYENAPLCRAATQESEAENSMSKPSRTSIWKDMPSLEFNINKNTEGELKIEKSGSDGILLNILITAKEEGSNLDKELSLNGKFVFTPKRYRHKVVIENGVGQVENTTDLGLDIDAEIGLNADIALSSAFKISTPQVRLFIPIQTGVGVGIMYQNDFGFDGKVNAGMTFKKHFSLIYPTKMIESYNESEGGDNTPTMLNTNDSKFPFQINPESKSFEIDGCVYIEPKFMLVGVVANLIGNVGGEFSSKFSLGTQVDLLNEDLYKETPMVTFDAKATLRGGLIKPETSGYDGVFIFLTNSIDSKYKMPEFSWDVKKTFDVYSFNMFPVFPVIENACVTRLKGSPTATVRYESSQLYLLSNPFLATHLRPAYIDSFKIVKKDYISGEKYDSNIIGVVKPKYVGSKDATLTDYYDLYIIGLVEDTDYYAVPVVKVFGFLTYEGNGIPLTDAMPRLSIIGPMESDLLGTTINQGSQYMTFKYGSNGKIEKIDNRLRDIEFHIISGSNPKLKFYEYDYYDLSDFSSRHLDYCTTYSNLEIDKESGVLLSCVGVEYDYNTQTYDPMIERLKFYYDDQRHLTSVVSSFTDSYTITNFNWDDEGRLISIESLEDTGEGTYIQYTYDKSKKYPNKHGQWTTLTALWADALSFSHLLGKASSELPVKVVVTDTWWSGNDYDAETWQDDVTYKFNDDGSILSETIVEEYEGEKATFTLPYGYLKISIDNDQYIQDTLLGVTRSSSQSNSGLRKVRSIFNHRHK